MDLSIICIIYLYISLNILYIHIYNIYICNTKISLGTYNGTNPV